MSSLAEYGIAARDVVRTLTKRRGEVVCPECGHPIGGTQGNHQLQNPDLVDVHALEIDTFVTIGYCCDRHGYDVIVPRPTDEDATNFPNGWTSVRIWFSDGVDRYVAIPEREVTTRD